MEAQLLEKLAKQDLKSHIQPKAEECIQVDKTPVNGLMRLPEILELIPVSKSTWWQGVKDGRFPKPIKLGSRLTVWKREDVEKLMT